MISITQHTQRKYNVTLNN